MGKGEGKWGRSQREVGGDEGRGKREGKLGEDTGQREGGKEKGEKRDGNMERDTGRKNSTIL